MLQPNQDRQIRVFISSTFLDMHAERNLLVKSLFSGLRRTCTERYPRIVPKRTTP